MQASPNSRPAPSRWPSTAALLGFGAVAAARLLTLPHSVWEGDEILFMKGIEHFDPLHHQPHPPGYPLLIGLGKLLNLLFHDPFVSLVALSVLSSLIGYAALVDAFQRIAAPAGLVPARRVAVAGALLFFLSPAMLVYGPLALSDPPAVMFLALALAAAARLAEADSAGGARVLWPALALGTFASSAVGCRPQLALAVLPMLAVALWQGPKGRRGRASFTALAAFTAVSLLWFVPLLIAVGGPAGLLWLLGKQAGLVAQYDASMPRAGGRAAWVAVRFLAHPWGMRWTSLPVLALAGAGIATLAAGRRWKALPIAVLCAIDLGFGLLIMNPFDSVRYALPSLLGVAFAAAVGCEALARRARMPGAVWPAAALLIAGFIVYTEPLLAVRTTTDSPPVQAARWIERSAPLGKVLIVEADLVPHAAYLLKEYQQIPADPGLQPTYRQRLIRPDFLLGDGESHWPGAVTFLWPDSDPYGKLTRGHFRVVSVSPIPLDRWYAPLRGFFTYEPNIRQPLWRWMGPDAAMGLWIEKGGGETVSLTLGLPKHAPLESVPVTIAVDGAAAGEIQVPRGGSRTIAVPIPAGTDFAEISFRSAASFVPAETGLGPDLRRLAVQLQKVERLASRKTPR
jgi:4-amino-4-deoxy-L-arabinose transferase-like glycosyltransferase